MVRQMPPHVKEAKEMGLLTEERFFRLVSEKANYIDGATIRQIYMALVAVVGEDLKANNVARLPHLGDLMLLDQKARVGVIAGVRRWIPEQKALKFMPNEFLRRHLNEWLRLKAVAGDPSIHHRDTPQI